MEHHSIDPERQLWLSMFGYNICRPDKASAIRAVKETFTFVPANPPVQMPQREWDNKVAKSLHNMAQQARDIMFAYLSKPDLDTMPAGMGEDSFDRISAYVLERPKMPSVVLQAICDHHGAALGSKPALVPPPCSNGKLHICPVWFGSNGSQSICSFGGCLGTIHPDEDGNLMIHFQRSPL